MSKEKQIEEMAEVMCGLNTKEGCFCYGGYCNHNCLAYDMAERLYNAGYRKQSEGEWKKHGNEKTCSLCKFIYYSNNDEWNYCPNCGARMKGGE